MTVHTPSLCNITAFAQPVKDPVQHINCRLIAPDDPQERDAFLKKIKFTTRNEQRKEALKEQTAIYANDEPLNFEVQQNSQTVYTPNAGSVSASSTSSIADETHMPSPAHPDPIQQTPSLQTAESVSQGETPSDTLRGEDALDNDGSLTTQGQPSTQSLSFGTPTHTVAISDEAAWRVPDEL